MTRRYIEVSARHHDQTLPIPFWLLKKTSYIIRTLDDGDGEPVTLFIMTGFWPPQTSESYLLNKQLKLCWIMWMRKEPMQGESSRAT